MCVCFLSYYCKSSKAPFCRCLHVVKKKKRKKKTKKKKKKM